MVGRGMRVDGPSIPPWATLSRPVTSRRFRPMCKVPDHTCSDVGLSAGSAGWKA